MTIAELIASREPDWRELEELARELHKPLFRRRTSPEQIARFSSLYRSVCSDLALADSYQLPPSRTTLYIVNEAAETFFLRISSSSKLRDGFLPT